MYKIKYAFIIFGALTHIPPNFNIKNKLQRVVPGAETGSLTEMQAETSMKQKVASY